MSAYPDWVDFVRFMGLDPITVWVEYRSALFASLIGLALVLLFSIYSVALRMRGIIANYKHSFTDRMAFHRSIHEVEEKYHEPLREALGGEKLVYLVPAIAYDSVDGFRRSVGHILLTQKRLIFAADGRKIEFQLDSFQDANVRDGNKHMELKLIVNENKKPIFHLLGISRDHAQEIFMKMHAFRVQLKESQS
ncbi:MAG: hypothetical protein K7J46_03140 [Bryobacter sp.]|jgi:hypothetical protein|nr:hypothetical protein [Bryobacter sp. CoA8 C33]